MNPEKSIRHEQMSWGSFTLLSLTPILAVHPNNVSNEKPRKMKPGRGRKGVGKPRVGPCAHQLRLKAAHALQLRSTSKLASGTIFWFYYSVSGRVNHKKKKKKNLRGPFHQSLANYARVFFFFLNNSHYKDHWLRTSLSPHVCVLDYAFYPVHYLRKHSK